MIVLLLQTQILKQYQGDAYSLCHHHL